MPGVSEQLEDGKLVCPASHQRLFPDGEWLRTRDRQFSYPVVTGVPILFTDQQKQQQYLARGSGAMVGAYAEIQGRSWLRRRLNALAEKQYRSRKYADAFRQVFEQQGPEALCLAVGGGPTRAHPRLMNLNIGLFANVEVVADAYALPYADDCVDVAYCAAVLEHLEYPDRAVAEMFRVTRPGGQAFAVTPFLKYFHAYPDHFQNFTLVGHRRLFERAGFGILSSGLCVGPTFVLTDFLAKYVELLPPRALTRQLAKVLRLLCVPVRALDVLLERNPGAHVMASATYVRAVKPG